MKFLLPLLIVFRISMAAAIQEVRGGGGGLNSEGHYMTFYSAKIPFLYNALEENEIPGLTLLTDTFFGLYLPHDQKTQLLTAINPEYHLYFKVDEAKISPEEKQVIIDQYAKLTGVSDTNLTLFALTAPNSTTTFLFSAYFQLKETEQAAVLLHEALWNLLPRSDLSYATIINIEMKTQAFLENPKNPENYYEFYDQLGKLSGFSGDGSYMINAAVIYDLQTNTLKSPGLKNGQVYLRDFIGSEAFHCFLSDGDPEQECRDLASQFLRLKRKTNPKSILIRTLSDHLLTVGLLGPISFKELKSEILENTYIDFNQPINDHGSFGLHSTTNKFSLGQIIFQ